jgi:TetR/AcrR family transcriptional regulator, transcriptional repressor for nem operon
MSEQAVKKRRRGRPPKDQAGFSKTKSELLRSGMESLTEKGYSATGIDEILRRVGVPKGSFYHYFGSKDRFGLELIENYENYFKRKLNRFLLDEAIAPLNRLENFMNYAIEGMARYEFKRGCLVGNLGQEMGALPEEFRAKLQSVFHEWQLTVERCLQEAQLNGDISSTIDCKESAYVFWIGWEGAVLRAKLEQSPRALKAFADFYLNSIR